MVVRLMKAAATRGNGWFMPRAAGAEHLGDNANDTAISTFNRGKQRGNTGGFYNIKHKMESY